MEEERCYRSGRYRSGGLVSSIFSCKVISLWIGLEIKDIFKCSPGMRHNPIRGSTQIEALATRSVEKI